MLLAQFILITRAELDKIHSDAKARAEENMTWFMTELEKASTDADRERITKEFNRRVGISS